MNIELTYSLDVIFNYLVTVNYVFLAVVTVLVNYFAKRNLFGLKSSIVASFIVREILTLK